MKQMQRVLALPLLGILSAALLMMPIATPSALASGAYTPRKGSAERSAIIAALHGAYQKRFHKNASFDVEDIKIQNGWASIYTSIEVVGKKYGGNYSAILRGSKAKWKIVGAFTGPESSKGGGALARRYPQIPDAVLIPLDQP